MMQKKVDEKYNIAVDFYNKKNYKNAYINFLELAKLGDIDSQNAVARLLHTGKGVEENKDEGYNWYKKSASSKNPIGLYMYGNYCLDKKNIQEGLLHLKLASELKYPTAVYTLAVFYDHGHYGYSQDREKALEMYKKAFSLGEKRAFRAFLNLYKEENGKLQMALYMIKNFSWMREALSKAT